jgi:hypothetical protein
MWSTGIYGHLVPGADIAWVDKLDAKPRKKRVAQAQPPSSNDADEITELQNSRLSGEL